MTNNSTIEPNTTTVLSDETMDFVRSLVDEFYKKNTFQINTENNEKWNRIVNELISMATSEKLEKKIIKSRDGLDDYLIRYYLINERPKLRVTLHNTLMSDSSELHNHPWNFGSLILTGGYWEDTPEGKFWRAPGNFRTKEASALHRLEVDPTIKEPVWTLFIMGEKDQDWGFLNEDGSIEQWQKYLFRQHGIWYEDQ